MNFYYIVYTKYPAIRSFFNRDETSNIPNDRPLPWNSRIGIFGTTFREDDVNYIFTKENGEERRFLKTSVDSLLKRKIDPNATTIQMNVDEMF